MDMDVAVSFGEVLKDLRTRKRMSRPKLARQIQMSEGSIEKWERGDSLPKRGTVEDLMRALKLVDAERFRLLEAYTGYRILPRLHNIPAAQNSYFTGREEILTQLHNRLALRGQVALTQAISGLGGIGKTQVALEYIYRFQKAYFHILWVTADSRNSLVAGFVRLALDLELPEKDQRDQDKIVQAVYRWLREYVNWLLILDNIEDLSLLSSFVPANHLGSVLLTTRRQVTEPVAHSIPLDILSDDEGAFLLLKRSKRLAFDEPFKNATASEVLVAKTITQQLGGLPLALDQAGAYILENQCSLSHYLDLFRQEQQILLQRRGTVPTAHPESVALTFSLALERVYHKSPVAHDLLRICAFLAPEAIPLEDLIMQSAAYLGTSLESVTVHALQLDQALEVLQAYSLVRCYGDNRMLFIHRLVQAVIRDEMGEQNCEQWMERVIIALNAIFPNFTPDAPLENWNLCERLWLHVLACAAAPVPQNLILAFASLLSKTAHYMRERAQYEQAEALYQHALQILEQDLGPDHHEVAPLLHRLAILYRQQGKYEQAEPLLQRALRIREQTLGPEHPDVAIFLGGLAILYLEQGRYKQAEPLFLQALRIREQVLEPEYPDISVPLLNSLANLYTTQGQYAQASPLYERALHIWEQQLGPEHPAVASPLNNLAELFLRQGKYKQSEQFYRRAHQIWKRELTAEHPDIAHPLFGLAEVYRLQGEYEQSKLFYQQALQIWRQALGYQHPYVAHTLTGLATIYINQCEYAQAEHFFQQSLQILEQALGKEHSSIASPLNGLANLYGVQGKYEQAEVLYQHALQILEQSLEPEHPDVASSLNGLANLYNDQGKYIQAEPLYQRALHIREQRLGLEHPETAEIMHDIARFWEAQGNGAEASVWYTRALDIRGQALGTHHLKTRETRTRFIALLHMQRKHKEAEKLEMTQSEQRTHEKKQKTPPEE